MRKSVAAFLIVRSFRHDTRTALTISASLAQIGEFSFILAGLGVGLNLLPEQARDLILGGAIISIMLNPVIFQFVIGRAEPRPAAKPAPTPAQAQADEYRPTTLTDHVILVGYGRVGQAVAEDLAAADRPFLVLDVDDVARKRARQAGLEVLAGNAADPGVLAAAGIGRARSILIAIPNGFEAGGIVQEARHCNAQVDIVARAHSDVEVKHLERLGADRIVLGERELAQAMLGQLRAPLAVTP